MIRSALRVLLLCVLAALLPVFAAACHQSSSSDSSITTPSPSTTTEEFTATLTQKGSNVHPFTVSATGTTTISLTSVAPLSTMSLGVSLGTYSGSVCTVVTTVNDTRAGSTALTGTTAAGSFCVKVFDSGNIMENTEITYRLQVVHP